MRIKIFILLGLLIYFPAWSQPCIPEHELIPISHRGHYHRIHPSGDYVLFTNPIQYSQQGDPEVFLVDLSQRHRNKNVEVKPTILRSEAYPVEPDWEYITSPDSGGNYVGKLKGLAFYKFTDLLDSKKENFQQVQPVFNDPKNPGYYHSVAAFNNKVGKPIIRATRWNDNNMVDYELQTPEEGKTIIKRTREATYCANITSQHIAEENKAKVRYGSAVVEFRKAESAVEKLDSKDKSPRAQKLRDELEHARIKKDKADAEWTYWSQMTNLATPIISKDGKFMATRFGNPDTIKVFRLAENGDCHLVTDTGYQGSKVSFSYPEEGKLPQIVFSDYDWVDAPLEPVENDGLEGSVSFYPTGKKVILFDLESGESFRLNKKGEYTAEYPGFTKDGRVMYGTHEGIAIVDAKRITSHNKTCIRSTIPAKSDKNSGEKKTPGHR